MFTQYPSLESNRLWLRQLVESDVSDLFEIFSSDKVTEYYGMFPMNDIEPVEQMINRFNQGFNEKRSIRWGLVEKSSGKVIGTCGYHNISQEHYRAEIGYELSEKYWNQGFMREALHKIICFGFEQMNFNRIEALVYPDNQSSRKALERLGFLEEGLLREYMYFRDEMTDLCIYSLLKRNWR
ncbi:MAG: GNAT family N-acetyltransferase [Clostridiales bacterium]|nr:GNAT family N-acetyltransferase [Clostridiales bacterium]